ncbi:MAG TPA: arsinothricin resistance N-acetyltransferase ArsN1 family B [Phenylobacterium sp.]|uniref:arsinothricin resistance N-acetyltransferase ArsN1 family B n=1 Tax=Phenylobacterium sp. TaxID=1871053 RepID=UPI002C067701|nr:arsinothricin resistance N-acetyltransferase ArsN1 family B [Phenylobacterium sp.]HSV03429.1 arsinothricin resistance N-acetyltransferase ArsN1 family B [Phenylobacterium sp.]
MIRPASAADAAAVAAIYAPIVEATIISFETVAPGPAEMARRIEATLETHPWLVFEDDGGVAGYAYAGAHAARDAYRWSVNVSVYNAERARRRGVGRALYHALFEILRRQGFHMAFAGITLPNEASVGLHEAMGFRPVGVYPEVGWKLGAWREVGYWGLELQPMGPPAEPIPFPDLPPA